MKHDFVIDKNGTLTEYRGHARKIVLPDTVKGIGEYVFSDMGYGPVKELTVPEGVLEIGDYAFRNSSLETIVLPSTLTSIGSAAFLGCRNLKSITIPEGVKTIWNRAFAHSGLEEICLPKDLQRIGQRAFYCCKELKKVSLAKNRDIEIADDAFSVCKGLLDDNGLAVVAGRAVYYEPKNGDAHLYVEIPDDVTVIGEHLFYKTSLMHLTMSLKCPSWHVKESRRHEYAQSIFDRHGSSIAFKDNDGNIAAKVILATDNEDWQTKQDCIASIRLRSSGGFDFAAYDSNFSKLHRLYNKAVMALVRLGYPYELADEMRKEYTEFLCENCAAIGKMMIDRKFADLAMDQTKLLEVLEQIHAVNSDVIGEVIGYAQQQGENEQAVQLLEYQKKFREEDPLAMLKLSDDVNRDNHTDDGEPNE